MLQCLRAFRLAPFRRGFSFCFAGNRSSKPEALWQAIERASEMREAVTSHLAADFLGLPADDHDRGQFCPRGPSELAMNGAAINRKPDALGLAPKLCTPGYGCAANEADKKRQDEEGAAFRRVIDRNSRALFEYAEEMEHAATNYGYAWAAGLCHLRSNAWVTIFGRATTADWASASQIAAPRRRVMPRPRCAVSDAYERVAARTDAGTGPIM